VVVLHDGAEAEDEIGERKAQQKCHKSWKCSEIARKPYAVTFFCESFTNNDYLIKYSLKLTDLVLTVATDC